MSAAGVCRQSVAGSCGEGQIRSAAALCGVGCEVRRGREVRQVRVLGHYCAGLLGHKTIGLLG